jgi:hypothetical protein
MVAAGIAMVVLGLYVVVRFPEHGFTPTRARRWRQSAVILRRGVALARGDREILLVLATTFLINGAAVAYGRLYPKRLVELGLPAQPDPIVWFTGLGIAAYLVGALALRLVEARIDGDGAARRLYAAACFTGTLGLIVLPRAPGYAIGGAGVLLIGGIALPVTRAVGEIWVNRRITSDVRATVQSFLAQVEYAGEILCGIVLGSLAQLTTLTVAFACAAALIAIAGVMVVRLRADSH